VRKPLPLQVTAVGFTGGRAVPVVTVTGYSFGAEPVGASDNVTSCGGYSNNGNLYGTSFSFTDIGNFAADTGAPPNGACVGIIVLSWTQSQIVFRFGNAYDTFDHWYITAGDAFAVVVKGYDFSGTVTFS
jgi:hypothetical protein